MTQYINKDHIIEKIKKLQDTIMDEDGNLYNGHTRSEYDILSKLEEIISTLWVKEVGDNSLEKFKSLQHISKDLKSTLQDWGYAPNLYYFDGSWHVDWISCEEGDSIKCFTEDTAEEAIDKAYNWFHSTFCNG